MFERNGFTSLHTLPADLTTVLWCYRSPIQKTRPNNLLSSQTLVFVVCARTKSMTRFLRPICHVDSSRAPQKGRCCQLFGSTATSFREGGTGTEDGFVTGNEIGGPFQQAKKQPKGAVKSCPKEVLLSVNNSAGGFDVVKCVSARSIKDSVFCGLNGRRAELESCGMPGRCLVVRTL